MTKIIKSEYTLSVSQMLALNTHSETQILWTQEAELWHTKLCNWTCQGVIWSLVLICLIFLMITSYISHTLLRLTMRYTLLLERSNSRPKVCLLFCSLSKPPLPSHSVNTTAENTICNCSKVLCEGVFMGNHSLSDKQNPFSLRENTCRWTVCLCSS